MKFLLDAQLPPSLKEVFISKVITVFIRLIWTLVIIHPDKVINELSIKENLVLITKDSDFYESFIIKNEPYKLILVKLGNTSRKELILFFEDHFTEIIARIMAESMLLLNRR